jgi:hypothetical protein
MNALLCEILKDRLEDLLADRGWSIENRPDFPGVEIEIMDDGKVLVIYDRPDPTRAAIWLVTRIDSKSHPLAQMRLWGIVGEEPDDVGMARIIDAVRAVVANTEEM